MTEPSRLARRLGMGDAVVIGLGSMIGAGVFAAVGPAADAAGSGMLVGLAIAAVVATCNGTSVGALAAAHPASGGAYVCGRAQLGPLWGCLARWGFVLGKTASCAAMALTRRHGGRRARRRARGRRGPARRDRVQLVLRARLLRGGQRTAWTLRGARRPIAAASVLAGAAVLGLGAAVFAIRR